MSDNNLPWDMDKPVEEIEIEHEHNIVYCYPIDWKLVDYLLARLKLTEKDRERLRQKVRSAFIDGSSGEWEGDFENWELNYDIDDLE